MRCQLLCYIQESQFSFSVFFFFTLVVGFRCKIEHLELIYYPVFRLNSNTSFLKLPLEFSSKRKQVKINLSLSFSLTRPPHTPQNSAHVLCLCSSIHKLSFFLLILIIFLSRTLKNRKKNKKKCCLYFFLMKDNQFTL